MLGKTEKFSHSLSRWFEVIGAAAILVMMIITCIDVAGAKIFLRPLPGAFDMITLAQLVSVVFAASFALILGLHVKVDFFVTRLPVRTQAMVGSLIYLLSLVLFILIVWRLILYGYELQISGEVSPEIKIPLYPFAYAIAFAGIPVCLVLLLRFLRSIAGALKR